MRATKVWIALAVACVVAGCGGEKRGVDGEPGESLVKDVAAPVRAPMKARETALNSARKSAAKARERAKRFDEVIGENR